MPHYGLLRDYRFDDQGTDDDIRGATVYGRNDEKLGKIDDVIFDHSTGNVRYVVVKTGWSGKSKFLVPPHRLHSSAKDERAFTVNLDKEQVESFPRFNESDMGSDEKWRAYEREYDNAWHAGPVQHRRGSDHNVTPTPEEMPEQPGSIGSQLSRQEQEELSSRIIPGTANEQTIQFSGAGIGGRWLNFESRLRQHRRDITRRCTSCTIGPAADRSAESPTQERDAI